MAKGPPEHPAKLWPTSWLFEDRSNQSDNIQIIDLLTDIRMLLVVIVVILIFF